MRKGAGAELCSVESDMTRGNGMEQGQERVRLGIRKRFFTRSMVGLPTELVMALNLLEFKKLLDNALRHMA